MARSQDDPAALPCPKCGYDLRGSLSGIKATTVTCPECGARWLTRQLTSPGLRVGITARLGIWGLLIALSPSLLSVLAVAWSILGRLAGRLDLVFAAALLTPVVLIPLGTWRYRRHPVGGRRLLRVAGFTLLYTVINCSVFFLLVAVLLIAIGLIAPDYLTA